MNGKARALLTLDCDSGDLWGWSMGHYFGIAETLHAAGEDVPASWEFRSGAATHEIETTWPDCEWYDLLEAGTCTADDLRHVGNVLCRYTRLLKLRGLDY